MRAWLASMFRRRPRYQPGTIFGRPARRDRRTGAIEFVLHPKGKRVGDYVYAEDWWCGFNPYWWKDFKPDPEQ